MIYDSEHGELFKYYALNFYCMEQLNVMGKSHFELNFIGLFA